MVGSDQVSDSSTVKKMASRLKSKRKKHHPPLKEPTNKTTEETKTTNIKTYKQMEESSTQIKTKEEPHDRNIKTHAHIKTTKETVKINIKTYAQIASSSTQIFDENEIFTKAIESANKHKIKLKAGKKDRGYGNCAFEAVINNNNDRDCFSYKLLQSPNWYRRSWMNEMMNRILMGICLWNPGYTEQQIREGFAKLQESGIYEIDFFGDMMIGGIACGIRKRILIFNTSENLVHDPISVIDPTHYDGRIKIDNETPVVVAYNNYHYENLHPVDEEDRQETIRLADSYIKDRYNVEYGFTKKDIKFLISPGSRNIHLKRKVSQQENAQSSTSKTRESYNRPYQGKHSGIDTQELLRVESNKHCYKPEKSKKQINVSNLESKGLDVQEINQEPWVTVSSKKQKRKQIPPLIKTELTKKTKRRKILNENIRVDKPEKTLECKADEKNKSDKTLKASTPVKKNECFKWENLKFEEIENDKIKCGICQAECLRLISHMNVSPRCTNGINMVEFKISYTKYKATCRVKKCKQKKEAEDPESFKANNRSWVQKSEEKKKAEDIGKFNNDHRIRVQKSEEKKKAEDIDKFNNDLRIRVQKV